MFSFMMRWALNRLGKQGVWNPRFHKNFHDWKLDDILSFFNLMYFLVLGGEGVPLQLLSLGKVFGLLRFPIGCCSFCGQ